MSDAIQDGANTTNVREDKLLKAFVAGANWWESVDTGFDMDKRDKALAIQEALSRGYSDSLVATEAGEAVCPVLAQRDLEILRLKEQVLELECLLWEKEQEILARA
jgi:hypothetical protein